MKVDILLRRLARKGAAFMLKSLSTSLLQQVVFDVISLRAHALHPKESLHFLFGLDAQLYPLQGELAAAYGDGVHPKHRLMRYHDFFVNRVRAGERVLDLGCGIGAVAYDVAKSVDVDVVGIDIHEGNIAVAKQRYAHPHIRYIVGDVLKELPGEHFDVVILSNVLEHLPNRSEFLKGVQAAVTPQRFLIRVPLFERDWRVPLKRELGVEWRLDNTHEIEYTLESFAEELQKSDLRISHQEVRWGEIWAEVVHHAP
jgi:SAM-dependent methyltransferase